MQTPTENIVILRPHRSVFPGLERLAITRVDFSLCTLELFISPETLGPDEGLRQVITQQLSSLSSEHFLHLHVWTRCLQQRRECKSL